MRNDTFKCSKFSLYQQQITYRVFIYIYCLLRYRLVPLDNPVKTTLILRKVLAFTRTDLLRVRVFAG